MSNNAYGKPSYQQSMAAKTYQANNLQGVSDRDAMAEAMRVIIHKLLMARDAYTAKALPEMLEHTTKTIKILDVLREEMVGSDALKDPEAGPTALFLYKLYGDAIMRITGVLTTPKPEEEFDAIGELFKPLYKEWKSPPPTPTGTQEVLPPATAG